MVVVNGRAHDSTSMLPTEFQNGKYHLVYVQVRRSVIHGENTPQHPDVSFPRQTVFLRLKKSRLRCNLHAAYGRTDLLTCPDSVQKEAAITFEHYLTSQTVPILTN